MNTINKGAFIEKSESISYCACMLVKCRQNQDGKLVSWSDGQFTGGIYHEEYILDKKVYYFLLNKGKPFEVEVYAHNVLL